MSGFIIYIIFFAIWYMFGFGDILEKPNRLICGMPAWFFYSSIIAPIVLIIMIFIHNKICDNLEEIDENKHR